MAEKILGDNISDIEHSKLRFVVDDKGSTKTIKFLKWGDCVRLVREPVEVNILSRTLVRAMKSKKEIGMLPEVMPF